jgi:protein SCO1
VKRLATALVVVALLLLAACGKASSLAGPTDGSPYFGVDHDPWQVASVPLTATGGPSDGKPVDLSQASSPLTLVFFGYTNCPDVCPIVMSALASAMTRLSAEDRAKVQVVFVTTDPTRDTPAVLSGYLHHYDPSFVGLTGSLDDLQKLALSFKFSLFGGTKLPSGGYDVTTHDTHVTAIDGATHQTGIYWDSTTSSAQFAYDIHALLKNGQ